MAMEPSFYEREVHFESEEDVTLGQKWKSITPPTSILDDDGDCFDCSICLDSAHDPVVTLCGHLYCWPCIYKWMHVKASAGAGDAYEQHPSCPVCKANISPNSMVPLYGRGTSRTDPEWKNFSPDVVVPCRPPPVLNTLISNTSQQSQQLHPNFFQSQPQSQSFYDQRYFPNPYGGYGAVASSTLGGAAMSQIFNPIIGMFGGMILTRFFGTSDTSLLAYNSYPNSNHLIGSYRMRRQEMQLEKSLNRVTIFLLCCLILCLLLF